MSWLLQFSDNANRADTSAGGVANGWVEQTAGYRIASNQFAKRNLGASDYASNGWLVRPNSEALVSQRCVFTLKNARTRVLQGAVLRKQSGVASYYLLQVEVDSSTGAVHTLLYGIVNGSPALIYSRTSTNVASIEGDDLSVDVSVIGSAPSAFSFSIQNVRTGVTLVSDGVTDATSSLQSAGTTGFVCWSGDGYAVSDDALFDEFASYSYVANSGGTIQVAPTTASIGVSTPITVTGTGTSWSSSTRLSVSGGAGTPTITGQEIAGQTITGYLNPGTAAGTLTIGDTSDSATITISAQATIVGKILFDGDSLTAGQYTTGENTTSATRCKVTFDALGPSWAPFNTGVDGLTLGNMQARIATYVQPVYDSSKPFVVVAQGGHNDIALNASNGSTDSANAAMVQTSIVAYVQALKAACPSVLLCWSTMPPAGHPAYPQSFNWIRNQVNAWLRANFRAIGIASLGDMAKDSRVGIDGSEYNSVYFNASDKTHPVDAGASIWGEYDLGAVRTAIDYTNVPVPVALSGFGLTAYGQVVPVL